MDVNEFVLERLILKIGNKLANRREKDLAGIQLTSGQSETILFFEQHPGLSITDLKNYLQISHQAARLIISRLEKRGFLTAAVSASDARARQIYLTAEGKALSQRLQQSGGEVGGLLLQKLSAAERRELYRLLKKISLDI